MTSNGCDGYGQGRTVAGASYLCVMPPSSRTENRAPRWVTIAEAADTLGVDPRSVRRMIKDGRLRGYQAGPRLIRLDLHEVNAALKPIEP
ncbi:hypothetical protein MINTM018_04170 [Mycobacterium intracellulare]|uniref:Helix-turn-helix domain-containing protein n=2 Tax=Mycobacterium intracellulare TaxID=1767 RepID=A0A7R7MPS7_MYCIT|nr:hypothetical protein MINTM018_04170 [Mycobacterium intracellulare]